MRVKWESHGRSGWTANIGNATLHAWREFGGNEWIAQYIEETLNATYSRLPSERAAKREAVRMWRALRGGK